MSSDLLLALLGGVLVGCGLALAIAAVVGLPERDASKPSLLHRPGRKGAALSARAGAGVLLGVLTLVVTQWPVMAVSAGLLVAYWDRLVGGGSEERVAILRLEALAVWSESLRDTIAGAAGLEQAIPSSVEATPAVLRPPLNLLVDRLRIREPLPDALLAFAEDLDDPSADTVVAALVLNARLRGPGLRDVLTALAQSTREELDMRRRIESGRRSVRRSVRIVLAIVLSVIGGITVFNGDYVEAYDDPTGQVVLTLIVAIFLAGLLWLRRLARPEAIDRLLGGTTGRSATAAPALARGA